MSDDEFVDFLFGKLVKHVDTDMIDLTLSAMAEQERIRDLNSTPPGQFPKPMKTKSDIKESNADRSRRLNTMRNLLK